MFALLILGTYALTNKSSINKGLRQKYSFLQNDAANQDPTYNKDWDQGTRHDSNGGHESWNSASESYGDEVKKWEDRKHCLENGDCNNYAQGSWKNGTGEYEEWSSES